ncbi:MAG: DNA ligase D [Pseudomonadota bacterium]
MPAAKAPSGLGHYDAKRRPGDTPEPFTSSRATGGVLFVVHHHAARAHHYDLRLEVDGVLWSWAVPKGPSVDPADKRLAVHVEPHPVDYAWFEGLIPEGNYGAGAMIIWDRGCWKPLIDPEEGLKAGKLLFDLYGFKLHGRWTLVRTGRKSEAPGKQWLLIKEQDSWVGRIPAPPSDSVVSGLTVEELKGGHNRLAALTRKLKRARVATGFPEQLKPMLCEPAGPFSDPDFAFEVKYDGYRVLAWRDGSSVKLLTRKGLDLAANFPELAEAVAGLPVDRCVLDAELVVAGADGLPDFSRLQQRAQLRRAHDVERAAIVRPATLYVFDLPAFSDFDLRKQPLKRRKAWLKELLPSVGGLRYVDHIPGNGEAMFEQVSALGLEGLVAKRLDSPYQAGERSVHWKKIAALRSADVVVVAVVDDGPDNFRSLLAAAQRDGEYVSLGRVGSGLDLAEREALMHDLETTHTPALTPELLPPGARWVKPMQVVEVRYKHLTRAGNFRQPVLLRRRPDRSADSCSWPGRELPAPAAVKASAPRPRVILSNEDKVFWPGTGLTKGDMLRYYRSVASFMLPYLKDRPIVMTRYPDGIEGKSFFQHQAPDFLPDWIRTEPLSKRSDEKSYIVIDSEDALLYMANLGTLEFHTWSARVPGIERPDYCILDLDPKGAPFTDVMAVARTVHEVLDAISAPHVLKTSGGTGLHILVPIDGSVDHEMSKTLGELLARVVVARRPDIATIQRAVEQRAGRVYVDYLQNGYGKTIAATLTVRPVPEASVSMPLRWSELKPSLTPARFNIMNAARRLRSLRRDPNLDLFENPLALPDALERLSDLMKSSARVQ